MERLQGGDTNCELVCQAAHLARGTVESDQGVFENFCRIEFGGSEASSFSPNVSLSDTVFICTLLVRAT